MTGYQIEQRLIEIYLVYSEMIGNLQSSRSLRKFIDERMTWLTKSLLDFKRITIGLIKDHCMSGLFTITFHLIDHLCTDSANYCSIASGCRSWWMLQWHFKRPYDKFQMKRTIMMKDNSEGMEPAVKKLKENKGFIKVPLPCAANANRP